MGSTGTNALMPPILRRAESILENIGLTSSEAVRLFYRQIELNQGIPFDVKTVNGRELDILPHKTYYQVI